MSWSTIQSAGTARSDSQRDHEHLRERGGRQNALRIAEAGAAFQAQMNALQSTFGQEEKQLVAAQNARKDTTAMTAAIDANSALLSQLTLNFGTFKATQAQGLVTVSVAALAPAPTSPASPSHLIDTLIGALAALLVARARRHDSVLRPGPQDCGRRRDRLALPCLAVVPKFGHLAVIADPRNTKNRRTESVMEAYRRAPHSRPVLNPRR